MTILTPILSPDFREKVFPTIRISEITVSITRVLTNASPEGKEDRDTGRMPTARPPIMKRIGKGFFLTASITSSDIFSSLAVCEFSFQILWLIGLKPFSTNSRSFLDMI
jgi:hypothetical protein